MRLQRITVHLTPNTPTTLVLAGRKVLGVVIQHPRRKARVVYRRMGSFVRPPLYVYLTTTELQKQYPALYRELEKLAHELQLQL